METRKIKDLTPYDKNPRKNKEAIDRVLESLNRHGQVKPIVLSAKGPKGAVNFDTVRKARTNYKIDPISVAQLLWRNEAEEILRQKKLPPKILRQPRAVLYENLVDTVNICELRKLVREYFKKRRNWRCHELLSRYDGLYQQSPTL